MREHLGLAIWIETNPPIAEGRGLERDGPEGRDFGFEWQAATIPFLEADKPWERAHLIGDGTPGISLDPEGFVLLQKPTC